MTVKSLGSTAGLVVAVIMFLASPTDASDLTIAMSNGQVSMQKSEAALAITIGDVATVTGGTSSDRRRVSELGLDTIDSTVDTFRINKRHVEVRVLIDGYHPDRFQVIGPAEVAIALTDANWLKPQLESILAKEITRQFGLTEGVAVRLLNEQKVTAAESQLSANNLNPTVLLSPQLPMGKSQIDVEFMGRNGSRFIETFDAQVIVSVEVALATQHIARGTVVSRDMIRTVLRPMLRRENFASSTDVVGYVASRDIANNEAVLANYITKPTANLAPTIKRNDVIDVVFRMGKTEVRVKNVKAMSSGKVGDTITVLNTQSNGQFHATVANERLAVISRPGAKR